MGGLYTYAWQKARAAFLRDNPKCAEHARQGRLAIATVVDHITPHKGNEVLFWDKSNWAALCAACHNAKTARNDGGFGNKIGTKQQQGCDVSGYPVCPTHYWRKT